jgi:hypothetical protein
VARLHMEFDEACGRFQQRKQEALAGITHRQQVECPGSPSLGTFASGTCVVCHCPEACYATAAGARNIRHTATASLAS